MLIQARRRSWNERCVGLLALCICWCVAGSAIAGEAEPEERPIWLQALDNDYYKININVRPRFEAADKDGFKNSEAGTVRTRLGIGSKPFRGFSGYAEMENIFSFDRGSYYNGVSEDHADKTQISDPTDTELNQLFLKYENPGEHPFQAIGGRQRIIVNDARFIGNVGWRQNEQTFDAAYAQSTLDVEGLNIEYGFLWEAHRIFGDRGTGGTRDYDSKSHFGNIVYQIPNGPKVATYLVMLDFSNSDDNSSNSFGLRMTGTEIPCEDWTLDYVGSFAWQTDAADNKTNYDAPYANVEGYAGYDPAGKLGLGYELLGSDDGGGQFRTPLATGHKFNGFADSFLDNGGPKGLQDLYFSISPKLPFGIKGKAIFHQFWSHEGGDDLGHEYDFVISKDINEHIQILSKGAFFDGDSSDGPDDIWRYWLEMTFKF